MSRADDAVAGDKSLLHAVTLVGQFSMSVNACFRQTWKRYSRKLSPDILNGIASNCHD